MTKAMSLGERELDPARIAELCPLRDPLQIAAKLRELIEKGELAAGARLPTVRSMAQSLGVSPGTISLAWSLLRGDGLIDTRRRGGTFVSGGSPPVEPARPVCRSSILYLYQASPDPALQPPLEQAMLFGLKTNRLNSSDLDYMIEALRDLVAPQWPFSAEAWTIAGASSESILVALLAVASPGDKVAVEQPTSPRLLRLLSLIGVTVVAVDCDGQGPKPDELRRAMGENAVAFVYQPRGHLPLGLTVTAARARELADILGLSPGVCIIEDDALGPLCSHPATSIGKWLPQQTVLVRSYCKAFGLDLRASIIGGSAVWVEKIRQNRSRGIGIASRILQGGLQFLLSDAASGNLLAAARKSYANRRRVFVTAIRRLDIPCELQSDSLMIWIPVNDEVKTLATLAEQGILASGGSHFYVARQLTDHIAISIGQLPDARDEIEQLATLIAAAAKGAYASNFD